MNNKTCGECKYYCNDAAFCSHRGVGWKKKTDMICKEFEPIPKPTNGDVIRQMDNEKLAKMLSNSCSMCVYNVDLQCERIDCEQNIEAWLNALAESEGDDE